MIHSRAFRTDIFNFFSQNAVSWFSAATEGHKQHAQITQLMPFEITPGGRNGGMESRIVDVLYGNVPSGFDFGSQKDNLKKYVQYGAWLSYVLQDNGKVLCFLFSAWSTNDRPLIKGFIFQEIEDVTALTGIPTLRKHFLYLLAYNECGRIDGSPSLINRLRVGWMYLTCFPMIEQDGQKAVQIPNYMRVLHYTVIWLIGLISLFESLAAIVSFLKVK